MIALLAFLKNWRVILGAALTVGFLCVWAYVTHLQHVARAQKAQLEQTSRQAQLQTVTTAAVDHLATKTAAVEERTRVIVRTIEAAPGADAPVPADVLRVWRDGLRDDPDSPPR